MSKKPNVRLIQLTDDQERVLRCPDCVSQIAVATFPSMTAYLIHHSPNCPFLAKQRQPEE